jgi:hypothetical protein
MSDNTNELAEESAVITPEVSKVQEHRERILRTTVACFMGILAGVLSYIATTMGNPESATELGLFGLLLLVACIVFQKHVFYLLRIDHTRLGGKDWFYQGFMTLALWFISWTILLTAQTLTP